MRHKPDIERRKKNQAKFKELLLQTEQLSDDTKKQIEEVTNFSSGRQQ
jgi:DnaJ-class molecular chaperone